MLNYIEGGWRESAATERVPVINPGNRRGARPDAVVSGGRGRPGGDRGRPRVSGMAPRAGRPSACSTCSSSRRCSRSSSRRSPARSRWSAARRSPSRAARCGARSRTSKSPAARRSLIQGYNSEDIAVGIDEMMIRQPLGVCAIIAPFNFPGMIPFWFLPYAIACGNTVVVKPSERVPLTMQKVFAAARTLGLPAGRGQPGQRRARGGRRASSITPTIRAVSFVGSSAVARHVYARAAATGKRVQCQGGAKNPVVVLPDADLAVGVRDHRRQRLRLRRPALPRLVDRDHRRRGPAAVHRGDSASRRRARVTGYGLDDGVQMGPVITPESRARIERPDRQGDSRRRHGRWSTGATRTFRSIAQGNFVRPTVLEDLPLDERDRPDRDLRAGAVDAPRRTTSTRRSRSSTPAAYGNQACLFTTSGASARKFRYEAEVGNVGINVGVAAPMAFFPFSGARESFFGDLHGQGRDAIEFFTQEKVVVERWPKEWTRRF